MARARMLRQSEIVAPEAPELTLRQCLSSGVAGFMVSVVNGPTDLLWRATEEAALRDGAEYVKRCYPKIHKGSFWTRGT